MLSVYSIEVSKQLKHLSNTVTKFHQQLSYTCFKKRKTYWVYCS